VYSTRGNRPYSKTFKDGKYRVKVRWEWRYWNAKTGKPCAWRGDTVTNSVRVR